MSLTNIFAGQSDIKLIIDGDELKNLPASPTIINDSTVVPVREVLEKFDAVLDWKSETNELFITKDDTIVLLKAGDKIANVNGEEKILIAPATIINDKLMIPVRFIAENFGFDVKWENRCVIISTKQIPIVPAENNNQTAKITEIEIGNGEYKIKADSKLDKVDKNILDGNRLVIDIKNCEPKLNKNEIAVNDDLISKIRIAQNQITPVKITRIVFDMKDNFPFEISVGNDNSILVSYQQKFISTLKNISCDGKTITLGKDSAQIDISQLNQTDDYCNKKYEIQFPCNIEDIFGSGKYFIRNEFFSDAEVKNDMLTIHENKIWAYEISDDQKNIYIKAIAPKEKYKNVLVIDAGHGGTDPGTINNSVKEKDLTFSIVKKILDLFDGNENVKVYSTRLTDVKIPLDDRINMANEIGDLFVSVHINSADKNQNVKGTEVYYCKDISDKQKRFSSKQLANSLLKNLVTNLGSVDRKVKTESYVVLKKATVPAALCEIGFITNPDELKNLCDEEYQLKAARAIYDCVLSLIEN